MEMKEGGDLATASGVLTAYKTSISADPSQSREARKGRRGYELASSCKRRQILTTIIRYIYTIYIYKKYELSATYRSDSISSPLTALALGLEQNYPLFRT